MIAQTPSLRSLSRFFFAANAAELQNAYDGLAAEATPPLPVVEEWKAVEFSFNRLFVGPRTLQAPPYASIYLDGDDTRLMGASTSRVRQLYAMLGLASPWQNQIPDDHLALELDALWQIEQALASVSSPQLEDARAYLIARLRAWVPAFVGRIQAAPQVHPAIVAVAGALTRALSTVDHVAAC